MTSNSECRLAHCLIFFWPALVLSAFAFVFDKLEQHIKQENLQRYQAQLEKGITELDKLPDSVSEVSTAPRLE